MSSVAVPAGLHVVSSGPDAPVTAPRVVIVHGAMDRSSSFGRVVRNLPELATVRYDRRGYGRSQEVGVGTFEDHVADLVQVLGDEPSTIFGHSIGGVIVLAAAARHPHLVRSVLAYEPPTPWRDWWPGRAIPLDGDDPADQAERFMRRAIGDRFWDRLPARTRADRRAEGEALRADIASLRGAAPFDPGAVRAPTVVAAGSDTTWWHTRAARDLVAEVPAASLATIAGAEHGAHLTHPAAVADLVRRAVAAGGPLVTGR